MRYINVDEDVYRELEQLAAAWHTTVAGALARFVTALDPGAIVPEGEPRQRPAPVAVHDPDAGNRIEATCEPDTHTVTEPLAQEHHPARLWWACRGCGTTFLSSDADMIADHVQGCELVDGAGNPLPGAAA